MAAAVRVHNLLTDNLSVLSVVKLELFGMTKMLKDLSVFVRDRDPHCYTSFLHNVLLKLYRFVFTAASCDQQPFPVDEGIRDFFPRAFIDRRDRGPGDVHPGGAGLLREALAVQKAQRLVFVHRHPHALGCRNIVRRKTAIDRQPLYPAASDRSCHRRSFLTYVNSYYTHVCDISQ